MADEKTRFENESSKKSDFGRKYDLHGEDSRIRVKLNVEGKVGTASLNFTPCWYLVNQSVLATIFALRKDIAGKFHFPKNLCQLYVDGFLVPDWESTYVLRENDTVILKFDSENDPSSTNVKQSQPVTASSISALNKARSNLPQGYHSNKGPTSTSSNSDSESDDESEDDAVKMKDTSRITLSKQVPDIVQGSKKRKLAKDTSSSDDNSSSSGSSDSEEGEKIKSVAGSTKLGIKKLPVPQAQKEIFKNVASSKSVVSEVNNTSVRTGNESSFLETTFVNNNVSNQNESDMDTSQAEGTGEPKEKKRRRRRRRKKPDTENTAKESNWIPKFSRITTPAPTMTEGQKHIHFESEEEDLGVQSGVTVDNTSANTSSVTEKPAQLTVDQTQTNNWVWSTGRYQSTSPNPTVHGGTVSKGPGTMQNYPYTNSQKNKRKDQSPGNLFAGTQVFNRKKYKKMAFCPLSKEEQLQSWQTNTSIVLNNSNQQTTMSLKPNQNGFEVDNQWEKQEPDRASSSESEVEVAPQEYSKCVQLHGPPRPGDRIAFKIMELSESYTPEISEFKEGHVTAYDPATQRIDIELTRRAKRKKEGRFDVLVEDDDEVLVGASGVAQTQLSVEWTSIVEARLITT